MFEKLLYEHLCSCGELTEYLAEYNGAPAIFNQKAPSDTDGLWESEEQYGRIVFLVNTQDSPDREKRGTLIMDIQCRDGKQIPEEAVSAVIPQIDGYFFCGENETLAAQWQSSDYFTDPTEKICGATLTFNLLAFPIQTTEEPDPIEAINRYTKAILENARVIGYDTTESVFKPEVGKSAIYWRITDISPSKSFLDNYHMKYRKAVLKGHIFAADPEEANAISRYIDAMTAAKKALKFPDGTYMRIDWNTRINNTSDPLSTGQITIEVSYGIMQRQETDLLENVSVKSKG